MQYFSILLALSSAVSAININLHVDGNCGNGNMLICENWNPNTCCSANSNVRHPSVSFSFIPRDWRIVTRAHGGGGCGPIIAQELIHGGDWSCLRGGAGFATISGGGYGFVGVKRAPIPTQQCSADSGGECTSTVKPNVLVNGDGTKYALTDMPEALYNTLVDALFNETSTSDLPAEIEAFKIEG